jgi:hypothetical protein
MTQITLLGVASTLHRVKSKAPALQSIRCKRGRLLLARRSVDATPSRVYYALLPAGLLHRKRLAMTCEEHRHCGFSLHVIAKAKPEAIQKLSLQQNHYISQLFTSQITIIYL